MPDFHAQHYNLVAKVLREEWPMNGRNTQTTRAQAETLVRVALNFAERFAQDNENFDPLKFLDAVSPNPNLYPLSKLWEVAHG